MSTKPSGISGDSFKGFERFRRSLTVSANNRSNFQGGYPIECTIKNGRIWTDDEHANFEDDYVILLNRELRFGCGYYYLSEYAEKVLSAGRVGVIDGKLRILTTNQGIINQTKVI